MAETPALGDTLDEKLAARGQKLPPSARFLIEQRRENGRWGANRPLMPGTVAA